MFANNALLGGGVRVRVRVREQRKIRRRSKALLLSLLMANLDITPQSYPFCICILEAINAGCDNDVGMRLKTAGFLYL